ncbi:MAG: type II toxin-antitoxin system RelB/DinJ family antitoxin [Deltaproteobacteria bacterium]|nr:type II toxin-antitoxin system RelB/DinJ family antitoxin [Deltaproteobacteria bacterium]
MSRAKYIENISICQGRIGVPNIANESKFVWPSGAEVILNGLGLNISSAVNLFLKQVINYKGIPFDLRLPNAETRSAMDDIR